MVKACCEDEFWNSILDPMLVRSAVTFGDPWIHQWSQLHQFQQQRLKKVTGLLCNPRAARHAVLHNYGFCSWSSAAGPERKTQLSRRSRVEASMAEDGASPTGVSAGAGLTIATSMTASHSMGTSRSLWKQNKLNNKGERWHSPPFSQLHQINCPSHRARDRCWSPRRAAQWRSDKSFSIPGFPPRTWLLREFGDEVGKAPSSAVVILPSAHHTHNQ